MINYLQIQHKTTTQKLSPMIQKEPQSIPTREKLLAHWLAKHFPMQPVKFSRVSGDASFRRYFRWQGTPLQSSQPSTIIGVDAPPEHEDCRPFVHIAKGLQDAGLCVPQVYRVDYEKGFMAISDLGNTLLLNIIDADNVDKFYYQAFNELATIQSIERFNEYTLPPYSAELLLSEMQLFTRWFLPQHLSITLTSRQRSKMAHLFDHLIALAHQQPQVTVHLDYHSRNLMVLNNERLGIIDFQDAVRGAITYDLISLVKDCYIKWPQQQVDDWMIVFKKEQPALQNVSDDEFIFWADTMSMQRHLKVAGIFSRLYYRDNKTAYLEDIPLTLKYLIESTQRHATFKWLGDWIADQLLPFTLSENKKVMLQQNDVHIKQKQEHQKR